MNREDAKNPKELKRANHRDPKHKEAQGLAVGVSAP
jgi:hypothetical protein